jgi:hypothetical protein
LTTTEESRLAVHNTLGKEAYFLVNKRIARWIGLEAAVLLSDLISKEKYFFDRDMLIEENWFFNKQERIEKDTTLSPHKQRKALLKLEEQKVIFVKKEGLPATNHFKINHDLILKTLSTRDKNLIQHNKNKDNNSISKDIESKESKIPNKSKSSNKISLKELPKNNCPNKYIKYWNSLKSKRRNKSSYFRA